MQGLEEVLLVLRDIFPAPYVPAAHRPFGRVPEGIEWLEVERVQGNAHFQARIGWLIRGAEACAYFLLR
ncbi:hypothetical protein D3C78_1773740 [compost metagenome]